MEDHTLNGGLEQKMRILSQLAGPLLPYKYNINQRHSDTVSMNHVANARPLNPGFLS
jgi:hypothetical protein